MLYYKECYKNPKNQNKRQAHNKKRQYEAHHNNTHYTSDNYESHASVNTPISCEDPASASSKGKTIKTRTIIFMFENYHLHVNKKLKAGSHVPCKSDHRQHRGRSKLSQKGKKGDASPTLMMDNDLNLTDAILKGLNSMDADLSRPDHIANPFNFNM